MARTPGDRTQHVAYTLNNNETLDPAQVRLHTSKVGALEDAVDRGGRYCPWKPGQTLAEAIAEHEKAREAAQIAAAGRAEREARQRPAGVEAAERAVAK